MKPAPWPRPGTVAELIAVVFEMMLLFEADPAKPGELREVAAYADDLEPLLRAAELVRGPRGVVH